MVFEVCYLLLLVHGFLCVSLASIALWDCCFVGLLLLGCCFCWWIVNSVVASFLSLSHALCALVVVFVILVVCCLLVYFGCL